MGTNAQTFQFLLSQVRASGVVLSGGKVYFYAAGTENFKTVWLDRGKTTEAANPYTLDANGTAQVFGDGLYDVVIKDASNVTKYTWGNVSIRDVSGNVYDVADYASLNAAVAAIGSTPATLQYASDVTVTANLVIPSTLELMPLNGAKINHGAYTITYAGSTARWPLAQVLNGTGAVSFTGFNAAVYSVWFGDTGDGVTNDYPAIARAVASINLANQPTNTELRILAGTHLLLSELMLPSNIVLAGSGIWDSSDYALGTALKGKHSGKSVVNLVGKNYITIKNMGILGDSGTPPKTVVLLGRAASASAGNHIFSNVIVKGYSTIATVYSIASEVNSWRDCTILNQGGGAKYALYTGQSDNLTVGGLTGSSNIAHTYDNVFFSNWYDGADASTIYIAGGLLTGSMNFLGGYVVASGGSYVTIETGSTDAGDLLGPLVFMNTNGEKAGVSTVTNGFLFVSAASKIIKNITILETTINGDTYFINTSNNGMTLKSVNIKTTPKKPSIFPTIIACDINLPLYAITVQGNALNNSILYDSTSGALTLNGGVNIGNIRRDIGTSSIDMSALSASAVWNPPSIAHGGVAFTEIAVAGAASGDMVQASFSVDLLGLSVSSYVSSAGNVRVVLANNTGAPVDIASTTVAIKIYR